MTESLLALRWNNHRSTFFHVLNSIKQKEIYSDATIACDGKFYPVHKLVLATCSEYFEAMFSRTQCKHPIIVLKDIGHEEVEALLNYMYIGEVNVIQNDLAGLIKAAECLRIKGLAVPDEDSNSNATKNSTALLRKHYDNATTRPSVVEDESPRPHKRRKRDKSEEAQERVGTSPAVVASPMNTPVARQEGNEDIQRNNSQETNTLSGDRCQDLPDTESSQMYAKVVMSEPSIKREVSDEVPHDLESSMSEEQHLLQGDYSYDGKLSSSAQMSEVETKLEPADYGSTHDPNLAPLPGTSVAHGVWQTGEEMSLAMGPMESSGGSEVLLPQGGQQQQQPGFTPSQQMEGDESFSNGALQQQLASMPPPPVPLLLPPSQSGGINTTAAPSSSTTSSSSSSSFACPYCHRSTFKTSRDFKRHLRTHTGERPFTCPMCPYTSARVDVLQRHLKKRHNAEDAAASTATVSATASSLWY